MRPARKRQRPRLGSARAYYRLAAKAFRAGNYREADHYRGVADRLVEQDRRERESLANRRILAETRIK